MLRKLRIAKRLGLAFGLLVLLSVVVGVSAMHRFSEILDNVTSISERRLPSTLLAAKMNQEFMLIRLTSARLMYARTDADRLTLISSVEGNIREYLKLYKEADSHHVTELGTKVFAEVSSATTTYLGIHASVLDLARSAALDQFTAEQDRLFAQAARGLNEALEKMAMYQNEQAQLEAENTKNSVSLANLSMFIIIAVSILIGIVLAYFFTRSLVAPLQQAVAVSQRIAKGDLTVQFDDEALDEAGDLIRALGSMQSQLRETMQQIANTSSQLAATSEELSVVTEQSARAVVQQTTELDMAATAVTELTTAIEDVARNALETSRNSQVADDGAKEGKAQIDVAIGTIQKLEADLVQARQGINNLVAGVGNIGSVLDVIRAIADQTNLLALNAAIEAARAGESGRGFAVVADEVRALAHRTQESTKEIEKMMQAVQVETQHTVNTIERTSQIATETSSSSAHAGTAFMDIAVSLGQINGQNLTVASAAEQQAAVAREVDRGLLTIRELSAQTAQGAHETQASSAELARLAEHLNQLVTQFKV